MMIKFLPLYLLSACGLLSCAANIASHTPALPSSHDIRLSIISTTDLHGHIEALPTIAGYINNLRAARVQDGGGVVVLDGGDMFQGELASNLNEGATVIEAYNQIAYSAVTVGNHEFDFGPLGPAVIPKAGDNPRGALHARAKQAHFPFLAANTVDKHSGKTLLHPDIVPSTIINVQGIRVGLVGVMTLEATQSIPIPVFEGLALTPLAQAISTQARLLRDKARAVRAQGATVVIAVAHAGGSCQHFDNADDLSSCDQQAEIFQVARALEPGLVDAIVAGHTHQKVAHRVNGIPIIQAGKNGETLARVDLLVNAGTGQVRKSQLHAPVTLCLSNQDNRACPASEYEGQPVKEDAAVTAIVARALQAAEQRRNSLVGVELTTPILRAKAARQESALANLVADSMLLARPQVDVAITHAGGLRADLPAGPLRYGALYEAYPRDSTFAIARLTAEELQNAIAKNLRGPKGLLISVSGIKVQAQCSGDQLQIALFRPNGETQVQPIAKDESLLVATNTLLALSAEGPFPQIAWQIEDDPPIREAILKVLQQRGGSLSGQDGALLDDNHPRISWPHAPAPCLPARNT